MNKVYDVFTLPRPGAIKKRIKMGSVELCGRIHNE